MNQLLMESDADLLDRYVTLRDEGAFRLLVERHAGMVLGVARRRTGDAALGEDAAQLVFTMLARKAASLRRAPDGGLGGWLHRTALLTAGNLHRSEMRRLRHHIRFADEAGSGTPPDESVWQSAMPLVDEAIDSLPEDERRLLVQHFFQRRTFREMSAGTGRTEDALRKRTGRAMERLNLFFRRRGVAVSAGTILTQLGAGVTEGAPAGFAARTAAAAAKGASSLSTAAVISNTLATMALAKITAAAAVIAFLTPIGLHWSGQVQAHARAAAAPGTPPPGKGRRQSGPGIAAASDPAGGTVSPDRTLLARFAQELSAAVPPPVDPARLSELQRLIYVLTDGDLDEAARLLRESPAGAELGPVAAALTARRAGAGADTDEALRLAESFPDALRTAALGGVLQVWGRRDFDAAMAWTRARPDAEQRDTLLDIVYHDLMKRDPAAALARLNEVPTPGKRTQYRAWTLESWGMSDPDGALAWLSANEPEETRDAEIGRFINDWATYRPDLTFDYTIRHVTDPHRRESNLRFALMQWGSDDPEEAIAALLSLPEDMRTANLAMNAAPFLALGDSAALLKATEELPPGGFRDNVRASAIPYAAADDPERARIMAESLTDPAARSRAAHGLAAQWMKLDAAAARRWIEASTDIPAESKKHLLKTP